jgi:hypothetical protein
MFAQKVSTCRDSIQARRGSPAVSVGEQKTGLSIEINPTVRALQGYKGFLVRIIDANLGITLRVTDFLNAKSKNHYF